LGQLWNNLKQYGAELGVTMSNRELILHEIDTMNQEELAEVYSAIQDVRKGRPPHAISKRTYIERNPGILGGEPIIAGTRTPVRAIVENWRMGLAPEEIPQHLPHLSLAQVFNALSYYSEHQEEINHYLEANRIPEALIDPLVKSL
jgi:uncharacterized protein (DUF433 family)